MHSSAFFGRSDLPVLINNVVHRREGAQEAFLEAIPLFLEEIGEEESRSTLIPFLTTWFNFSNITIAKKMFSIIPIFLHKYQSSLRILDFLFIINEIIRLNSILVEKEAMELVTYLLSIYDTTVIDSYLLPSLDRMFGQSCIDAMGIVLAMQARLAADSSPPRKQSIIANLFRVVQENTSYLMMILLKYLPCFCFIADNAQEVIEAVLMPSFVHQDFKVRARSLSGLESIAETFFAIYDDISPFRKLASDPNWSVRYSFSINSSKFIEFATAKDELGKSLIILCTDSVNEVRTQALLTLAKSTKFLSPSTLETLPEIFDRCMLTHSEAVRDAAIQLWGALLVDHPNAPFHNRFNKSLALLGSVPIHDFIHKMLKYVVTKLPSGVISVELLDKALATLMDTNDKPQLTLNALEVLRLFTSSPALIEYTKSKMEKIKPLLESPVFAIRCEAGNFFVDCTKAFGWDWANQWFIPFICQVLDHGSSVLQVSAMRTATALLSIDPPDDIAENIRSLLIALKQKPLEVIQLNTNDCLSRLDLS